MSIERQQQLIEKQIADIIAGIAQAKRDKAENFTIKQMEKTRRGLESKLEKLNSQTRKDDVINFEQLGIDKIFVDEAVRPSTVNEPMTGSLSRATSELMKLEGAPTNPEARVSDPSLDSSAPPASLPSLRMTEGLTSSVDEEAGVEPRSGKAKGAERPWLEATTRRGEVPASSSTCTSPSAWAKGTRVSVSKAASTTATGL